MLFALREIKVEKKFSKLITAILIFVTSYFWEASLVTALDLALATCKCIKYNLSSNYFH